MRGWRWQSRFGRRGLREHLPGCRCHNLEGQHPPRPRKDTVQWDQNPPWDLQRTLHKPVAVLQPEPQNSAVQASSGSAPPYRPPGSPLFQPQPQPCPGRLCPPSRFHLGPWPLSLPIHTCPQKALVPPANIADSGPQDSLPPAPCSMASRQPGVLTGSERGLPDATATSLRPLQPQACPLPPPLPAHARCCSSSSDATLLCSPSCFSVSRPTRLSSFLH